MKIFVLAIVLAFGSPAYAKSNIVATWIDQDQTLSVQIVDDPRAAPFVAGEIWKAIRGNSSHKLVKTKNFELKCSGSSWPNGRSFGDCKIRVARSAVITQPGEINFAISKQEAQSALIEFEQPSGQDSILVKSGMADAYGNELFIFEVNWRFGMIAGLLNESLLVE